MPDVNGNQVATFQDIEHGELMRAVSGQLAPAALAVPVDSSPEHDARDFAGSAAFWRYARADNLRGLDRVTIRGVSITEWFPRSPGLYDTAGGADSRLAAEGRVIDLDAERRKVFEESLPLEQQLYDLYGKLQMLNGGVGCLRLSRRETTHGGLWFMSATSQGRVEQGVPVALSDHDYERVIASVRHTGVYPCDISGQLLFAPEDLLELYRGYAKVPRFFLKVESLTAAADTDVVPPVAGAAVFFVSRDPYERMAATYIDFRVDGGPQSLGRRLDFLETYVSMHSGTIATDFDEQFGRFATAVFSLKKIGTLSMSADEIVTVADAMRLSGQDVDDIIADQRSINLTINHYRQETHVGDVFRDIGPGATIVSRSVLTNALNSSGDRYGPEVVDALTRLSEAVASSNNPDAIDNMNGLAEELAKEAPSKGRIRTWLSAIGDALPDVAAVSSAVATIGSLVL
jgi:hypothetical protein